MRRSLAAALLTAACGSATPPASDAAAVDVADAPADASADVAPGVCPAPLGSPTPRAGPAPAPGPMDAVLRVNHLQAKGTHNSYHLRPAVQIPDWDYEHAPLEEQLARQGVRALELDLHWVDDCQRFRVLHVPGVDGRSSCDAFTDCLGRVRRWSDAHRGHHPLFVQLEPKGTWPDAVVEARLAAMEREILSVFPRELVVTPDEVRGTSATLAEAVRTRGWPTLGATRGRVIFFIDRTDNVQRVYTHGGRDLAGRLSFVDGARTDPFAAVLVLNNARSPDVPAAVREGFLVRVFSWSAGGTLDDATAQAALDSGAQIVSTDFPAMAPGVTRWVDIPGGAPSRCNPLVAPMGCTARAVEDLAR